jgi:hypothetical protein
MLLPAIYPPGPTTSVFPTRDTMLFSRKHAMTLQPRATIWIEAYAIDGTSLAFWHVYFFVV